MGRRRKGRGGGDGLSEAAAELRRAVAQLSADAPAPAGKPDATAAAVAGGAARRPRRARCVIEPAPAAASAAQGPSAKRRRKAAAAAPPKPRAAPRAAPGSTAHLPGEARPALRAGKWATLRGLVARKDLNGQDVRLLEWLPDAGRWAVRQLALPMEHMRVRPECLEALDSGSDPEFGTDDELEEEEDDDD
eukprot:TRINITY_DN17731_c0_g1_i1.p2 TRINITY_DN17731_c0_g1~~TRINITY_DN17731_c0_g1_i1.p2  ORF type:complete len:218 (+),score=49.51 TRINITY_DN17731_c0_g1_i1:82-654(+)